METLFELFSNPIALFILIGVISSLFNKKKDERQPQRRPVRPQGPAPASTRPAEARPEHRFDNDMAPENKEGRMETRRRPVSAEADPINSGAEILNDIQKVYLDRKRQTEHSKPRQNAPVPGRMSSSEAGGRLRQKREQKEPEIEFQPDKDTLVQGLIWAEVLGKPRAKQPYHPGRRK